MEKILKDENYAIFVANLGFGEGLYSIGRYCGKLKELTNIWDHVKSVRLKNEEILNSEDFKRRKIILSAFDKTKYTRSEAVEIINNISQENQKKLFAISERF